MAVPEAVRKVKRPQNTVVVAYGKNMDRYAVKLRIGCERLDGKRNPRPKTGATIGHIIPSNGPEGWKYVAKDGILRISDYEIDRKDWGNIQICVELSQDLLDDLKSVYSTSEAEQIYCSAVLRACYPGIRNSRLREKYLECFLSEIHPGVALSKNTFGDLLDRVGKANLRIQRFMDRRMDIIEPSHHVILDSTLKKNKSMINDFSEFSRKVGADYPMISIMYAFDLELMEPVTMEVYPGNMVDARAFSDFVKKNRIDCGIIVADKGFPPSSAEEALEASPGLHYLIPLKDNSSLIRRYSMLDFDTVVEGYAHILGKKVRLDGTWLYSFRDTRRAASDERAYIEQNREGFDGWEYDQDRRAFGAIVFECDLDLELDVVYKAYECRWMIELMFRMYKIIEQLDDTRIHGDYSIIASEFINFLSTVMTGRIFRRFEQTDLLKERTYGEAMEILRSAKKQKDADGRWNTIRVVEKNAEVLERVGLVEVPITVKNPVGRPKKSRSRLYSSTLWETCTGSWYN